MFSNKGSEPDAIIALIIAFKNMYAQFFIINTLLTSIKHFSSIYILNTIISPQSPILNPALIKSTLSAYLICDIKIIEIKLSNKNATKN